MLCYAMLADPCLEADRVLRHAINDTRWSFLLRGWVIWLHVHALVLPATYVVQVKTAGAEVTGGRVGFDRPRTDADAAGAPADGIAEATGVARTTGRMDSS